MMGSHHDGSKEGTAMRPLPNIELTPRRFVGEGQPCYLVAEVGQNHNGQMMLARRLIDGVAGSADAVKFCKRHIPSELTPEAYRRPYLGPQSFGPTYGEHREALELSLAQHVELKRCANTRQLTYFATACDERSVDDLEELGVPFYKIASRDLANLPLLDYVARTRKPLILSCGMDATDAIALALDAVRRHHDQIILLQCTSAYPTAYEDVNLRAIESLRREFEVLVGLSDHSLGTVVPSAAVALGAVLIEKHVTLKRNLKGTDHACSLELSQWRQMAINVRAVERALGDGVKCVPPAVAPAKSKLGRTVVSRYRIPRGTRVTEEMLCLKSAGEGLTWLERQRLIGRIASRDIAADEKLTATDVE
jgi:sialic acid synthase